MTVTATVSSSESGIGVPARTRSRLTALAVVLLPFVAIYGLAQVMGDRFPQWAMFLHDARTDPGEDSAGPIADALESAVSWFRSTELLGLITGRDLMRALFSWVQFPYDFAVGLLSEGVSLFGFDLPPLPWLTLAGAAAVVGHAVGGWRLAVVGGGTLTYLAVFDLWEPSMLTLALVAVSAPLSILIGWALGLWAARSGRVEAVLTPILNVMQSMPHYAYFIPIIVFIGLNDRAPIVATVVFAVPPMAKLTTLAIRGVPDEVREAGLMSGVDRRQMLWKIEMPAAKPALMVGVNQVIMQCLGMVVLAALIGARGLGQQLLNRLQALRIGEALEMGLAIVFMAIMLDRLSQAAARRRPEHRDEDLSWAKHHPHATALAAVVAFTFVLAAVFDWALVYPAESARDWTITTAPFWDAVVDYVQVAWRPATLALKEFLLLGILLPLKDFLLNVPWVAMAALVAGIGWRIGGARVGMVAAGYVAFIAVAGFWIPAMESLYLGVAAVGICVGLGVPLGILVSRSDRLSTAMQVVLDTFQTMPSFIYLIPVVMLFQVGPVAALFAVMLYAFVPAVRYAILGMHGIPDDVIEAADTSGCTPWQRLVKVKLPLAMPEIMLGVNQVLMFALLMLMIAALIGGIDGLGDEILIALRDQQTGKGLVVGLSLAAMGLATDTLIARWAEDRKRQLGLA